MSEERTIHVNGEPMTLRVSLLAELLESLGHEGAATGVAVAVNGEVVPRASWGRRALEHGDRIDIVGAVQGG